MSPRETSSPGSRVLVVEDSSIFREMQTALLRQAGFVVSSFERPAAALVEARDQSFDLALIDYELPGMNGDDFMGELRKLQPGIPVIVVSGSLTHSLVGALTRLGAAGIFSKPANPKLLLEKIRETLRGGGGERALRAGAHLETGVSHIPFPLPEPSADRLAYEPRFILGAGDEFRRFTHRLWRVRDFRTVLLLQGEAGSPFDLLAQELIAQSVYREGPTFTCHGNEFEAGRLSELLAPALLTPEPGTLIVHGVEDFSAMQQALLLELISVRGMFQPFARRFRLLLATTPRLAARVGMGVFDEALFYKVSALSLVIPTLAELRGDIAVNAARIWETLPCGARAGRRTISADAADWLEKQSWPGNYDQLSETLILAASHAAGPQLDLAALEAGAVAFESQRLARHNSTALRPAPGIEADPSALGSPSTPSGGHVSDSASPIPAGPSG